MYWLFVFIIAFISGIILDLIIAKSSRINPKKGIIHFIELGKCKVHHSIIGLVSCTAGFFIYHLGLLGFGAGIILSHSIREKSLLFLEFPNKRYF